MRNSFLKYSNPILRKVSKETPLNQISSKETHKIIQKMLKIAYGEQKDSKKPIMVGLAAPQIGISKRIILVDIKSNGKGKVGDLRIYINPEIISQSKTKEEWYEGCYSIPEVCGIVQRSESIKIEALTPNGEIIQEEHKGYIARIFQHEIDHLDGKLFVDLVDNPNHLHHVKPEEFPLYRNKQAWKNWPKKHPLPLANSRLKQI